jgi:acetyltransferase-like isoleucine patch superfamily enzyme
MVRGGITVGKDAIVGAGETVEDDVPEEGTWIGRRLAAVDEGRE